MLQQSTRCYKGQSGKYERRCVVVEALGCFFGNPVEAFFCLSCLISFFSFLMLPKCRRTCIYVISPAALFIQTHYHTHPLLTTWAMPAGPLACASHLRTRRRHGIRCLWIELPCGFHEGVCGLYTLLQPPPFSCPAELISVRRQAAILVDMRH